MTLVAAQALGTNLTTGCGLDPRHLWPLVTSQVTDIKTDLQLW